MSKKILILSDSHSFDNLLIDVLKRETYDYVVFAGDYTTDIEFMKQHFDYFIDGNNDYGHKEIERFEIDGVKFVMVHSHTMFSFDKDTYFNRLRDFGKNYNADVVIYGHTHFEHVDSSKKPILVNPGSIALPRNAQQKGSYIIATIDKNKIDFKIKYIK